MTLEELTEAYGTQLADVLPKDVAFVLITFRPDHPNAGYASNLKPDAVRDVLRMILTNLEASTPR